MGFLSKIVKAVKFQFSHIKSVVKGIIKNPIRALTGGGDPLSTKIQNTLFGTKFKPLYGQLGGATEDQFASYEAKNGAGSLGFARSLHAIAETVAGFYAGGAIGKLAGKVASVAGSKLAGATAQTGASAAGTTAGGAADALPEIVVTGTRAAASPLAAATGAGIGATAAGGGAGGEPRTADSTLPSSTGQSATQGTAGQKPGLLGTLKNAVTSEAGLQIIGGALQGYANDAQQKRTIEEQRRYTRPFTTDEISSITKGMDVRVPGGFLENARRVGDFLNGSPRVGPPTLTPEQVAGMARGG